jgi:methylmalonyl-CoA mutase
MPDPTPTTSLKTDWLHQVARDLKGRSTDEFRRTISPDVVANPFVTAEDFAAAPTSLRTTSGWQICEKTTTESAHSANDQLLEALRMGAEGLVISFDKTPDNQHFAQLLEGVYLDYVGLHFEGAAVQNNPGGFLAMLCQLARQRGVAPASLSGSVSYDPLQQATLQDWRYLAELLEFGRAELPRFRLIEVAQSDTDVAADASLADLLGRAETYLRKLHERGVPATQAAQQIQFRVLVGTDYFLEIARLRALSLLWMNVLRAWQVPVVPPGVAAFFDPKSYDDALYTNMVRGTTMAMSAILGGATQLCVAPYDTDREAAARYNPAFGRRIARNVQHLLRLEGALDAAADAAAGSFFIEKITQQLAQSAWHIWTARK